MIKDDFFELSNGVKIPKIGFGTWQIPKEESYEATKLALKAGYTHIDTALAYQNEVGIGEAIKESNIKREDLFITTKCPAEIKGYNEAKEAFYRSLKNLDLDYIDLYLIHAPWPWSNVGADCEKENIETWKAFIDLYNEGLIKSIGVSNFRPENIKNIVDATGFYPHVNQIRYFIGNTQDDVYDYCIKNNILVEAYSPLATGNLLNNELINEIANKYQKTASEVCLSFCLQNNTLPLPKTTKNERMVKNLNVETFLKEVDIKALKEIHNSSLDRPLRS